MDDPDITMEEYIRLETEKALRKVIVYNDALTSELELSCEPTFYKELEAESFGEGAKLMGLQLLQLELRFRKNPSRSFRPVKSAKILWQFWASSLFRVSLAHDGSWSNWEPSLWLCG
ncbi:hypothetical protein Tco_0661975 [Tanacetum coccineum]